MLRDALTIPQLCALTNIEGKGYACPSLGGDGGYRADMWEQRKRLIEEIEARRKSRLLCYVTSDRPNATAIIAKDAVPIFYNQLRSLGNTQRLDVLISTTGGDTLAAFGIARLVREFAKWVGVIVPDKCLSAGTLFALGANEIFMTRAGMLSPIDPSITTQLNPAVEGPVPGQRQFLPISVESVAGFKGLLENDWAIKSEDARVQVFRLLAERVHPLALGDVYRSRQQIERLAKQLLIVHRKDHKTIQKIIATLTRELGSHDYPISRAEARRLMGKQISADDSVLEGLTWELFEDYRKELELGVPYNPAVALARAQTQGRQQPVHASLKMAVIESAKSRDAFEQEMLISEAIVPGPTPVKTFQQALLNAGWRHYAPEGGEQS